MRGSVSFSNVRASTVERVTAALVLSETQRSGPYRNDWVQGRYEFVIHEGEAFEGEAIPFGLSLPRSLPVTMRSAMIEVGWSLEIGVEGGWSSSTLLAIPVMLLPVGSLPPVELRPQPPSVGRARRRQLWGPAATRAGLTYDPDADVIRGEEGAVRLSIAVEQRVRDGLFTTATLRWTSLGMGLSVGPSRWNDRFTEREIDVGDRAFDDRLRVRGRFAGQVRALLDAEVRACVPADGRRFASTTRARRSRCRARSRRPRRRSKPSRAAPRSSRGSSRGPSTSRSARSAPRPRCALRRRVEILCDALAGPLVAR